MVKKLDILFMSVDASLLQVVLFFLHKLRTFPMCIMSGITML